jgi:hypothetical protein
LRSVLHEADIDGKNNAPVRSDDCYAHGCGGPDAENCAGGLREMVLPSSSFFSAKIGNRKNDASVEDNYNVGHIKNSSDSGTLTSVAISRIVDLDG